MAASMDKQERVRLDLIGASIEELISPHLNLLGEDITTEKAKKMAMDFAHLVPRTIKQEMDPMISAMAIALLLCDNFVEHKEADTGVVVAAAIIDMVGRMHNRDAFDAKETPYFSELEKRAVVALKTLRPLTKSTSAAAVADGMMAMLPVNDPIEFENEPASLTIDYRSFKSVFPYNVNFNRKMITRGMFLVTLKHGKTVQRNLVIGSNELVKNPGGDRLLTLEMLDTSDADNLTSAAVEVSSSGVVEVFTLSEDGARSPLDLRHLNFDPGKTTYLDENLSRIEHQPTAAGQR